MVLRPECLQPDAGKHPTAIIVSAVAETVPSQSGGFPQPDTAGHLRLGREAQRDHFRLPHAMMYDRAVIRLIGSLAVPCLLMACRQADRRPEPPPARGEGRAAQARVRSLLQQELLSQMSPEFSPPSAESLHVVGESSRVIPDLVYYWGISSPPRSVHATYFALAACRSDECRVLTSTREWAGIVGRWAPTSQVEALEACVELIHTTSERRSPTYWPLLYRDSASLRDVIPPLLPERRALSPPVVNAANGAKWHVSLWVAEAAAMMRYDCALRSGSAALTARDSILGAGFVPMW